MLAVLSSKWWVLLLRGLAAIALGVVAMMWPAIQLWAIALLFAAFALADGVASIVLGFKGESDGSVWWTMVLMGVLAVVAGIVALVAPITVLATLLGIIAAVAILRGVFEIVAAIRLRAHIDDEWVLGLSGVLSVLFGVLLISRPEEGLVAIAILMGAYMVALGSLAVALSLRLRRLQHRIGGAVASAGEGSP
jgi:uncharacterized membrane protein HdeD (DUF308 family)